jgi:REP element-mobilizing transposase RayT
LQTKKLKSAYFVRGSFSVEMHLHMAIAYFITFSTYGTWLHGADKGMGSVDRDHNEQGADFVTPDPAVEQEACDAMAQPVYTMDAPRRERVRDAIVSLAKERAWQLLAVHVRSNHVHVVIRADRDPGRLMSDLKGRASRDLTLTGFENADRRRWTRHGSTKHLFTAEEVEDKIEYTLTKQGTPMALYDARTEPRTK